MRAPTPGDRRFTFPRRRRLRSRREFQAVYARRASRRLGPLVLYAMPNGTDETRLGLSIPRRVGRAVRRNRVRRRLREAFRAVQHDLPGGYDVVINVLPHEAMAPAAYAELITNALRSLHRLWSKSSQDEQGETPGG